MKYIVSYYQYPVTFSSVKKTIPARSAVGEMKNIAEFTEKEIEKLKNCEPFFRELLNNKKIRILNHIPQSYIPPAQQVNEAHAEADKLKAENEALKARLAALEAQAEEAKKAKVENEELTESLEALDDSAAEAKAQAEEAEKADEKPKSRKRK